MDQSKIRTRIRTVGANYTHHHVVVFLLTFFSYAFFHACRKTFSNVKETVSEEWSPSFHNSSQSEIKPDSTWNKHKLFEQSSDASVFMGVLDASFMIAYAVGLFISGMLGDRFDLRKVLSFGMCSTAVVVFIFGPVLEWNHFYNKYLYVFLWILNGLLQSTGWPSVVAVMGNWFGKSSRGFILGLWSACASVGNIIGALLASAVLKYGYEYTFVLTGSVLFAGGIINFFALVPNPKDIGLPEPDEGNKLSEYSEDQKPLLGVEGNDDVTVSTCSIHKAERPKAISFVQALLLPGVILYSLSYACLKLVNYSFFFWLPYYLSETLGWAQSMADKISVWYDVGGIVGGTVAGFISDRFKKRAIVVIPMLILSIPSLFWYSYSTDEVYYNAGLMGLVGFFIGGVANLISAAISADLGRQKGPTQGNSEALSTVTGIVDGTGSVGAAVGQILVPVIGRTIEWAAVFYLFMIMTFLTGVCIFPLFVKEWFELFPSTRNWFPCTRNHVRSGSLIQEECVVNDDTGSQDD